MACSTAIRPEEHSSEPHRMKNEPSKRKSIGFAIAVILGLGSLAMAGAGLGGYLQVGSLSSLSQVNSMIMMAAGSGGGILFLILGIVGFFKNRQASSRVQTKINLEPTKNPQVITSKINSYANVEAHGRLIYGADAWTIWNAEVLDTVPDVPKIRWDDEDPHFKEAFRNNYVLLYIPEKVCVNGQEKDFTLKTFKEMREGSFREFDKSVEEEFGGSKAAGWVLISKTVIPVTREKDYETQKKLVEAQKGFYMPHVLEAAVLNLMVDAFTQEMLYGDKPIITYTRCEERVSDTDWQNPIIVGGFDSRGLSIEEYIGECKDFFGAACVLREFQSYE